jgi:hypothetical protein
MGKNTLLLLAAAALGALYWMSTRGSRPSAIGVSYSTDKNAPNYGTRSLTNPVVPAPVLTQYSLKQAIVDLPALLDAGGALFTPAQGSTDATGMPVVNYADTGGDVLGGYYNAGAQGNA